MFVRRLILGGILSLSPLSVLFVGTVMGGDLLAYKPYTAGPIEYNLSIKSHAVIDSGPGGIQEGIFRDHEDILTLSQQVKNAGYGLLDIMTTVKNINVPPHGPIYGAVYKREDIPGNTQQIKINLLGEVEEAKVIPHIGSRAFWQKGDDGPPLDFYNILLMLNPRFRLGVLNTGDTWEAEDTIEPELVDPLPVEGTEPIHYELKMTVRQKTKYTLLGYEKQNGYRCARIGFEAEFRTDGVLRDAHTGSYVEGIGKSAGEFFFAPKEGLLVSVSMTHHAKEKLSNDGQIIRFLNPEEMVFLYSDDHKSIPLPWRVDRTVTLELLEGK
jgi:hypothetical protein